MNVPGPTSGELYDSKEEAYVREEIEKETRNRMQSLWQFSEQTNDETAESDISIMVDDTPAKPSGDNISKSTEAYREMSNQLSSFYQPTSQQENEFLTRKVEELTRKLEESHNNALQSGSADELLEKSYQMAARYLGQDQNEKELPVEQREILDVSAIPDNVTSSLEQPMSNLDLIAELSRERNYGFNTAVGSSYKVAKNTFNACISEDQTLIHGQRVKMRLLEPLQAGNVIIPVNSPVTGTAAIVGERLDIVIHNIEYAGNILPVQLTVHDIDGQQGIYVPDSQDRTAAKEAVAGLGEGMGSNISVTNDVKEQVTMDLARGAIQSSTRLFSQKVRQVKVTVKAGYRVLLVAKEN